ncbi:low affinity immunoglobulin epsilon Fc receptor-like [Amphiura filiformis]|uniref:low affinity immunoglobulin epsilon Fc receptor-like n=1 Tax=Amphiura filiformis TaxID=82378 RepID=UPI003B21196C
MRMVNSRQMNEMTVLLQLAIVFICLHNTTGQFTCPTFFEAWANKCYYFQGGFTSPILAETTCGNLNTEAIPVLVESQAEADFLAAKLNADHSPVSLDGFWLRCKDAVEGQWTCDNSSNFWNSAGDNQGFWDWGTDGGIAEPNGDTTENCLVLGFDGKLHDVLCQLTISFNAAACEITMVTPTPAPTSWSSGKWYHYDGGNNCLQNHAIDTRRPAARLTQ